MAKINPQLHSSLKLTRVLSDSVSARYFFSSFSGDPPLSGMDLKVKGFLWPGNNLDAYPAQIITVTPDYVAVIRSTQRDEIADATGSATSPVQKECAHVPKPPPGQNLTRSRNKSACFWKTNDKNKRKTTRSLSIYWKPYTQILIGQATNWVTKSLARYWKRTLTAAQRAAWESAAATVSWQNYDGQPTMPNGFQFFMKEGRLRTYLPFSPYGPYFNMFINPMVNPPAAWTHLPDPPALYADFYNPFNGAIIYAPSYAPPFAWVFHTVIAHYEGFIGGRLPEHYMNISTGMTLGPPQNNTGIIPEYPFAPNGFPRAARFGVMAYNPSNGDFSDFTWVTQH